MSKRTEHEFLFTAEVIAAAAAEEAGYHRERENYWRAEQDRSGETVLSGADVELHRAAQTGGERLEVRVNLSTEAQAAHTRMSESFHKAEQHRQAAERLESDATMYATQSPGMGYMLDTDDVHFYRLSGRERAE